MLIDFNKIKEIKASGMNNGTGKMSAKMYMDEEGKIIPCRIHAGTCHICKKGSIHSIINTGK